MPSHAAVICFALTSIGFHALPQEAKEPPLPAPIAKFWQKIAKAKTLAVQVRVWDESEPAAENKPPTLRLMNIAEVKMKRPNLLSVLSQPPQAEQTPHQGEGFTVRFSGGGTSYISDGVNAISLHPFVRSYQKAKPLKSLTQNDRDNPLNGLFLTWALEAHPMSGLLPQSKDAEGRTNSHFTIFVLKDPRGGPNEEWHYFNSKTGDLLRWAAMYRDDHGKMIETMRKEYLFWEFDPKLPKNTFDTSPPKNWDQFTTPKRRPNPRR